MCLPFPQKYVIPPEGIIAGPEIGLKDETFQGNVSCCQNIKIDLYLFIYLFLIFGIRENFERILEFGVIIIGLSWANIDLLLYL